MSPKLRTRIPPFHGASAWIHSEAIPREKLHGTPVLIHFWAIGCAACKAQMPALLRWKRELEPRGLRLVGVHSPAEGTPPNLTAEAVQGAADDLGLTHPIVVDPSGMVAAHFDARATPAYFVFDHSGSLRHYQAGVDAEAGVERALMRVIEEEEASRSAQPGQPG